jgi:hypothetical protein
MNYTKGEWKVKDDRPHFSIQVGRQNIASISSLNNMLNDEKLANAHLIAAAPEMYEALRELSEITHDLGLGDGTPDPQIEASNKKARQALAKAEGREEK